MTFFYVRDDTHQIFDARGLVPNDEKMREYSEFYGCDISIIEGTTVKTYERPTKRAADVCPNCGEDWACYDPKKPIEFCPTCGTRR